jgi:hypothetical protein
MHNMPAEQSYFPFLATRDEDDWLTSQDMAHILRVAIAVTSPLLC